MQRSLSKGPFLHPSIYKHAFKALQIKEKNTHASIKPITVYSRASVILPEFVGLSFKIHRGDKKFILLTVTENHIGHKFGEFALTRALVKHSGGKTGPVKRPIQKGKK